MKQKRKVRRLMSADEVAEALDVTTSDVRRWAMLGLIGYFDSTSGWTFYGEEIDMYVKNRDVALATLSVLERQTGVIRKAEGRAHVAAREDTRGINHA